MIFTVYNKDYKSPKGSVRAVVRPRPERSEVVLTVPAKHRYVEMRV